MPAALRTRLRPPSQPTRYASRSTPPSASATSTPSSSWTKPVTSQPRTDRDTELVDPAGEDALDVVLPQPQRVRVAGREVADVQRDPAEARDWAAWPSARKRSAMPRWSRTSMVRAWRPPAREPVELRPSAAARRRRRRPPPASARRPASGQSDRPPRSGHRGRSLACRRSASAEIVGEGRAVVNVRQPAVLRQPLAAAAAVPCHWPRRSSSPGCRAGQERRRLDTSPSSNRRRASVQDGSWRLEVQLLRVRSVCRKRAAWAPRSLDSLAYRSGAAIDQDPGGPASRGGDP